MTEVISASQFRAETEKKRKYGNVPTTINGIRFDSGAEARRYYRLRAMVDKGEIRDLERQPVFILAPSVKIDGEAKKRPAVRYRADFAYTDARTGRTVIEDVKSDVTAKTKHFRRIQHLLKVVHGLDIKIVK